MSNKFETWLENNPGRWEGPFHDDLVGTHKGVWFVNKLLARSFPVGTRVRLRAPAEGKLPFSMGFRPREQASFRKNSLIAGSAPESRGIVIMSGAPSPGFKGILVRHESGSPTHWDYYPTELVNLDARERILGEKK